MGIELIYIIPRISRYEMDGHDRHEYHRYILHANFFAAYNFECHLITLLYAVECVFFHVEPNVYPTPSNELVLPLKWQIVRDDIYAKKTDNH